MRWMVILMTVRFLAAQDQAQDPIQKSYGAAVADLNAGRIVDARKKLQQILKEHPDYFRGYRIYWDAVGRTQDEVARYAAAERDLKLFEAAPAEKRTEDFYNNMMAGYEILGNTKRTDELRNECKDRYPRGLMAQEGLLDAARREPDPVKAAQSYADFIKNFAENASWVQLAASDRFELMANHPDRFNVATQRAAAEDAERQSRGFVIEFGNPSLVLIQLQRISNVFAERDPATARIFAQRGLTFIQEQWPQSDEITEQHRVSCFWLPLLAAHSALKDWAASRRIGEALIKQIEDGSFSPELADETRIRKLYAEALQNTGLPETARVQRELAADPSRSRKRREDQVRAALNTSEQRRPAVLFRLNDLNGNTISLTQLRGKAIVLTFWATWCGPCIVELEEWKTGWEKYRDNINVAMLAISTDSDKGGVAGFAKERGYRFPILLTDGTIEETYKTQTIPQLYVLDPSGDIRFQETGYSRDGFFLKKLDWMIEAVLK